MTDHFGYEKHETKGCGTGESFNDCTPKTLRTDDGRMTVSVPRDRDSTFEPSNVGKHERHFDGFDVKHLAMYASGMTMREMQGHLSEIYGTPISAALSFCVTDAVVEALEQWRHHPLASVYPIG